MILIASVDDNMGLMFNHRRQSRDRLLRQRIKDIRVIDRAKCMLIAERHMSEPEAHAYIEKRAMNYRQTKRDVAEEIIRSF